jgi:hypothetical protein
VYVQLERSRICTKAVQKIARKSKGVGIELKASADGTTGILLRLEIREGDLAKEVPTFQGPPDNLPYHCAVVLRLISPWLGKGRVVVADAAFGSYTTAVELAKIRTYSENGHSRLSKAIF